MSKDNKVKYLISKDFVTIIINGVSTNLTSSHSCYKHVVDYLLRCLRKNKTPKVSTLKNLISFQKLVKKLTYGNFNVNEDGSIIYRGKDKLCKNISDFVVKLIQQNLPYDYVFNFLEKCKQNPHSDRLEALFTWISQEQLSIAEDGDVLGYRSVREDYKDHYSGTYSNHPGASLSIDIKDCEVSDLNSCGKGFHIGTYAYASSFHPGNGSRIMLCKFNPKDVISLKRDGHEGKLRVSAYTVIAEHGYNNKLPYPIYKINNEEYVPVTIQSPFESIQDDEEYE